MYATAVASQLDGMFQMQHLVIHDVFDRTTWHRRMVEDSTYHDRVMSGIVMSKTVACMIAAPCHLRPGHESIKEARIQFVEDCLQVVGMATGRLDALATTYLSHQVSLLRNVVTGNISPIAAGMLPLNGTPVHLSQQNMCNRA